MSNVAAQTVLPLWPKPIPIIGGTGAKGSGKSRFGLSICPGPKTLVYDLEQSTVSYDYIGFERVDIQKQMHSTHPKGYKPTDLWVWWLNHVRSLPVDKYRVIMVDPVTDLERGLADWVVANPSFFGHTPGQYAKMSGIMWGDAKDYLKMVLADITARCETFYFTAHIGAEFVGNTATGKMKPKGKETLFELASLYLWFERNPDKNGALGVPSAHVRKSRLEVGSVVDGEVVSYAVLPPRIPVATPKAIREYFKFPAGSKSLVEGEKAVEEKMSDDARLELETRKAEALRDIALGRQPEGSSESHSPSSSSAAFSESPGGMIDVETQVQEIYRGRIQVAETIEALQSIGEEVKAAKLSQDKKLELRAVWNNRRDEIRGKVEKPVAEEKPVVQEVAKEPQAAPVVEVPFGTATQIRDSLLSKPLNEAGKIAVKVLETVIEAEKSEGKPVAVDDSGNATVLSDDGPSFGTMIGSAVPDLNDE